MEKDQKDKPQPLSSKSPTSSSQQSCSTISDFEILKKLGQGAHGTVFKVRRKIDNNTYVLKQISTQNMSLRQKKDILSEAFILNSLDSEYIVKYYDSFLEGAFLNIVMEYCDGGDLETYIRYQMNRPIAERKVWKFFLQMALGLRHLHDRKILHRDIKTLNVFLSSAAENIRIGDLGVAKVLQENNAFAHAQVGTPFYMSPEVCQDIPYNDKCDIWSLGVVLYELCVQKKPFEANSQPGLISKIIKAEYAPLPSFYSKEMGALVAACLTKDYKKRPSINDLLANKDVEQKAKNLGIVIGSTQKHLKVASSSTIIGAQSDPVLQLNLQLQVNQQKHSPQLSPSPQGKSQQQQFIPPLQNIQLKSMQEIQIQSQLLDPKQINPQQQQTQQNFIKKNPCNSESKKVNQLNQFLPNRSITKFQIIQDIGSANNNNNNNNINIKQTNFLLDKKYSSQIPQNIADKNSGINFKSLIYPIHAESQPDILDIDDKKINNGGIIPNFSTDSKSHSNKKIQLIEQLNFYNSVSNKVSLYSSLQTPISHNQANSINFNKIDHIQQIKQIVGDSNSKQKPNTPYSNYSKIVEYKIEKPKYLSPLKKEEIQGISNTLNLLPQQPQQQSSIRHNPPPKIKNYQEKHNTSPCHSPTIRKRKVPNMFSSAEQKDKKNNSLCQENFKSKVQNFEELQQQQIQITANKENQQLTDLMPRDNDVNVNYDSYPEPIKELYKLKKEKSVTLQQTVNACINQLGKTQFIEIYQNLQKHIDSETEYTKTDQAQLYQYLIDKLGKKNQMCIFNIYKIMQIHVDIKTVKEKIEIAKKNIESQIQKK